jgi:hypothetical protein
MRVEILQDTVANRQTVRAGETVDLSDIDARHLISTNKAKSLDTTHDSIPDRYTPQDANPVFKGSLEKADPEQTVGEAEEAQHYQSPEAKQASQEALKKDGVDLDSAGGGLKKSASQKRPSK